MDIDRVHYFNVFADTGSLVKASEVLRISQPALSKALKLLEVEVGMKLLEPDGRGLKLTMSGESFRQETKALLSQWLQVPEKIRQKGVAAPTRIGTFEVFSTYFLRSLSSAINLQALELHEFGPGKLEDALLRNVIDLGVTYLPIPRPGIEFIEISRVEMGIYGIKSFERASLTDTPFVIPLSTTEAIPSKVKGLDGWPDHKIPRKIAYRVTLMESALQLCRQGLCLAYLPKFIIKVHNELVLPQYRLHEISSPIPLKDRTQSVYIVQRSNSSESKIHRQVAKALRSLS